MLAALILVEHGGTLHYLGTATSARELRLLHRRATDAGIAGVFRIAPQLTAPLKRYKPAVLKLRKPDCALQRHLNERLLSTFGTGDRKRTHDPETITRR